ncbi:MAG TPA: NAD(P)-binding protein, partial [Candidatus Nanoarchaeia archaeon]|nr:NAD(P)-binding protein [Candidatus Nanoarchaeia archaeon]
MKGERVPTREQEQEKRIKNFEEVNFGYNEEEAIFEASRCLQCKVPKCVAGCPVNIDIPKFIGYIKDKKFPMAIKTIKKTNNLPGICGRVCPQENQCEKNCIMGIKNDSLNIGKLERFASQFEDEQKAADNKSKKKIAIVGSGPAGLTCAADLALLGHKITIYEALHDTGGVLRYGIPEFRLPKKIVDKEVEKIKSLGVEIKKNAIIGKTFTLD